MADKKVALITGPINLGNPGEFTMLELAQRVIELTESKSIIKHLPLPQDDPKQKTRYLASKINIRLAAICKS